MLRITITSVPVDDQAHAHEFYTKVLGFQTRYDVPVGEHRWLTVVSPADPDGPEILLEPTGHPAIGPFREALVKDGIPWTSFTVDDVHAEHARLSDAGVEFTVEPVSAGPVDYAVFDDTCGNLIQITTPPKDAS